MQAFRTISVLDEINLGTGLKQNRSRELLLPTEIGHQANVELEGAKLRKIPRRIPIMGVTKYVATC